MTMETFIAIGVLHVELHVIAYHVSMVYAANGLG